VINEMLSTVTAFRWDGGKGAFSELQTVSTLPKGYQGNNSTAEVVAHPSGKFLYGSNRGHNSLAVFQIKPDGTLTHTGNVSTEGEVPRNFNIDPTGKFVIAANQNSNSLVVFRIDAKTGDLTPTGEKHEVGSPVCVRFLKLK
jgi:6-phosphogluconolactonase